MNFSLSSLRRDTGNRCIVRETSWASVNFRTLYFSRCGVARRVRSRKRREYFLLLIRKTLFRSGERSRDVACVLFSLHYSIVSLNRTPRNVLEIVYFIAKLTLHLFFSFIIFVKVSLLFSIIIILISRYAERDKSGSSH